MAIESIVETSVAAVLILIAPGYLALLISLKVRGQRVPKEPLSALVYSLILSVVVAVLYYSIGRFESWTSALAFVSLHPVSSLLGLVVLTVGVGFAIPLLISIVFLPLSRAASKLVSRGETISLREEDVWDVFMGIYELRPLQVETRDGREFRGFLASYSTRDEKYTLHLSPVEEVVYDSAGNPTISKLGESILLLEEDIKRIIALDAGPENIGHVVQRGADAKKA